MKGTRPLNNNEILLVSACFDGTFEIRNRGLFMLGVSTGGRISELLSLQLSDVYQNGRAETVTSPRRSELKLAAWNIRVLSDSSERYKIT